MAVTAVELQLSSSPPDRLRAQLPSLRGGSGRRALPSDGEAKCRQAPRPLLIHSEVSKVRKCRQSVPARRFGRGSWNEPLRGDVPFLNTS
ncbi:uncharacterized protein WM294_014028 isoform 2-T2 [Sarcoramphus papa]